MKDAYFCFVLPCIDEPDVASFVGCRALPSFAYIWLLLGIIVQIVIVIIHATVPLQKCLLFGGKVGIHRSGVSFSTAAIKTTCNRLITFFRCAAHATWWRANRACTSILVHRHLVIDRTTIHIGEFNVVLVLRSGRLRLLCWITNSDSTFDSFTVFYNCSNSCSIFCADRKFFSSLCRRRMLLSELLLSSTSIGLTFTSSTYLCVCDEI